MKVVFPNPFGNAPVPPERVAELQRRLLFSAEYAEFLATQNGFIFDDLRDSDCRDAYLAEPDLEPTGSPDIRVLYNADARDPYYDLEDNAASIFSEIFLPIGAGYGGDEYVEVLAGENKGRIASLDHEMYAGCEQLDDLLEEFDLSHLTDSSRAKQADALADSDLGLMWFHADSFRDFLSDGIHCDARYAGFVVGTTEQADDASVADADDG